MTSVRASVWGSALTLAVAVAATFSAGGADMGSDGTPDPCRLLSGADIGAPVDVWVGDGVPRESIVPEPGLRMCGYVTASPSGEIAVAARSDPD